MSISAIYILDVTGKTLISRDYRGVQELEVIEEFLFFLLEKEEETTFSPVFQVGKTTFAFINHNNLYFVAITNSLANITMVFVFLHKLVLVMEDYLKEVVEESVLDNFVVIHELLDEILDFGYPQIMESNILKEYITQEGKKLETARKIPPAVTNSVSWRPAGIKYKNNEVFMDIIESVDLMVDVNGSIVCSEITGSIIINAKVTGMPELLMGLNDKLQFKKYDFKNSKSDLDGIKFHQCVRLSRFVNDGNISFVPPDGEFELMSYRFTNQVKPPLWVDCVTEHYPFSRVEYSIKVTSQLKSQVTLSDVDILIPVRSDADSPMFKAGIGIVSYVPEKNVFNWSIKLFPGSKEFFMTARFRLPSVKCEEKEAMPPIQVRFLISSFNLSGLRVKYLKVFEKSGYQALPWVRLVTQSGDYHIRHKEVIHYTETD